MTIATRTLTETEYQQHSDALSAGRLQGVGGSENGHRPLLEVSVFLPQAGQGGPAGIGLQRDGSGGEAAEDEGQRRHTRECKNSQQKASESRGDNALGGECVSAQSVVPRSLCL